MKYINCAALLFCALATGSCVNSPGIESSINGPRPIMYASRVSASTQNYLSVRDTFIRRSLDNGASTYDWYQVARAGYGYVDEQCSDYLGKLRDIRIARDTTRAQLASFQTSSNSVLNIVGASKLAIGVTAAAFGLASQVSDNATINLLYAMDPSDIEGLIKSQTQAYRSIAEQQRISFTDSNVAMDSIRGYLNICLPVSIEAQVKAAVRNTTYVASASSPGVTTLTQVATGSPTVPSVKDVRDGGSTRVKQSIADADLAGGLTTHDVRISKAEAMTIQSNLCAKATGDLGGVGSGTRKAIIEFQNLTAASDKNGEAIAATGVLDKVTRSKVHDIGPCPSDRYKSLFEHIKLSTHKGVAEAQKLLADFAKDPSSGLGADVTSLVDDKFVGGDTLTDNNRKVISAAQTKLGQPVTGTYTIQLQNALLLKTR
ncbi:hypothetical protein ACQZ6F_29385 [Rhizobium sp. A22-96]